MQRSAIVFLTPGQLAGQMHTPRLHFKEHMHTEKTPFQLQIWPQKRGQFPDLQFVPFPIEGWFWGPLIGLRNSASFSPFALFGAQYLVSMAAAATIFCRPDRLHHQNVYLLQVSLRNHNHMRSIQLLRLQAHTHTQWGPTATKPEMIVFETPKTGLLTVLLRTQNHMLSTQPLRLQTSTHIDRVHGCKAWFLAKRSFLLWTCCVQCRRNTARHTRQHHLGTGNSNSGSWR